ncbi:hypothetical protein JXL19_03565 [bacterium]|nr:hypothetical protein [bacterium]
MFRKIVWINIGLFVIVVLLSYNLYTLWSRIMEDMKAPSVQVNIAESPERTSEDEEKEEVFDYKPSSRMSYSSIIEKDLFRPEREEWQPPPPPEEEDVDIKQISPYPQFPGQGMPQPEMKTPTVLGIILIGEARRYAIMQGWTREDVQERTRKIRLGDGTIREVPLPPVPGKVTQDKIKAYRIGDYISEEQIVDILPEKVVLEKNDGERYDVLLREQAKLDLWKVQDLSQQSPGQVGPGGFGPGQMPVVPDPRAYPIPPGIPPGLPAYPYIPVYPPVPPPGYIPPQAIQPPQGGFNPPLAPTPGQRPSQQSFPGQPGLPQGRFPFIPGQPVPGVTN